MWVMYLCPDQLADFFFSPSSFFLLLSFFIPADFFIRLRGRRPSVTKHYSVRCVWWKGGGRRGVEISWSGGGRRVGVGGSEAA